MNTRVLRLTGAIAAAAMLAAACSSSESDAQPTTPPTVSDTAAVTVTEAATMTTSTEPPSLTEQWAASSDDLVADADGGYSATILLSTLHPDENLFVHPYTVSFSLLGEWVQCEIDADTWTAAISPSEHPLIDARTFDLRPDSTEITPNGDTATVQVLYTVTSGDDTATLVLAAETLPGCAAASETAEAETTAADSTGTQTVDTTPVESDDADDGDEGETAEEPDESADDEESSADDEESTEDGRDEDEESDEADEPEVTEPEPQRVQLRRWNHRALIDLPLWSHCPPEVWPSWLTERLTGYERVWVGWDSETVEIDGYHIASGWWTDEQLGLWLPGAGVTAESARLNARYFPSSDFVSLWENDVTFMSQEVPPAQLPTLTAALRHRGHDLSFSSILVATRVGIAGSGAWPEHIDKSNLLTSWMRFRLAQPPTTAEPVAWPLRSLFEAHEAGCVAEAMVAVCASGETPDAMLERGHPIGRVLRSLACGE